MIVEYFRGWSPKDVRAMPASERRYWARVAARRMDMDEVYADLDRAREEVEE